MRLRIGDRITFRAATLHSGAPTLTRTVNGFDHGRPTVRCHGWPRFVVRFEEITKVEPPKRWHDQTGPRAAIPKGSL